MPAPATVDEFLELIPKSGIVEEARLLAYVQKLRSLSNTMPREPSKLAGLMVRDGLLTYFQAEQLLQGKWKRFTIGKYKVLERLGSGGMGQVFLCEHKLMRRRVAVKVLPTAKAEDPSSLERFYREARAAAALDHQNIVRAYDIDQDDNLHFLVMEFVDGSSFQDIIKKTGPMEVLRAAHYVYWAAIGMQHAHEQGIIHRDIKPANILVDRQGVVKILDMGLARFFNDDEDLITKKFDENVLGTADYLAPEQALDSHTVDGRADIYSLGATFYFMLTGGPPFVEGTVAQKLIWHQNREPKPLKTQRPDVPEGIALIIAKMMAKDPANRFQTPAELAAVLAPWIQTPIAPPAESEMLTLCPAVMAAGTGMVSAAASTAKGNSVSGSGQVPTLRKPSLSSMNLVPLPVPPGGSSRHPGAQQASGPPPLEGMPPPLPAPPAHQPTGGNNSSANLPMVEPLPPDEAAGPGEQVWATFSDTNPVAQERTDRKPASSHRRPGKPAPRDPAADAAEPRPRPRGRGALGLWLGLAVVVVLAAVGLGLFLLPGSGSSPNAANPKDPPGVEAPRVIQVSRQTPESVKDLKVASVARAMEIARPKDQIVLLDEEWDEVVQFTGAKKELTLGAADGKRVHWRGSGPANATSAVFEIGSSTGTVDALTLKNITFHAGNRASAVRLVGSCPGLRMVDVELTEARDSAIKLVECQGDASRRVVLERVRVVSKETAVGVSFFASAPRPGQPTPRQCAYIRLENCRLEGPFKAALFQIEGQQNEIEIDHCRLWNAPVGIQVQPLQPTQLLKFTFSHNTFHTLGGPLLKLDAGDPLLQAPNAGKHRLEFTRNYLFNVGTPAVVIADGKPVPVTATENGRNAPSDASFATPVTADAIPLGTDPNDDAKFLRHDQLKAVGPMKLPLGASAP